MPPWHPNNALRRLIDQYKARNPGQEVVYTIADDAHSSTSDHAEDPDGTVDAGDFMPGPTVTDTELDDLAETLRLRRDRRIKYVIRRQRIFAGNDGPQPWVWRPYSGKYHGHTHVSTVERYEDDGSDWQLTRPGSVHRKVDHVIMTVSVPLLREGDDDNKREGYNNIARIQRQIGFTGDDVDGIWGPATTRKLGYNAMTAGRYQALFGLTVVAPKPPGR